MVKLSTITLSEDMRIRIKSLATLRNETYEDVLNDFLYIYNSIMKFKTEQDFSIWFEKNLDKFGFIKVIKRNITKFPDYILEDNNHKEMKVELELLANNYIKHKHPKNGVDYIISVFSKNEDKIYNIPVISLGYAFNIYTTTTIAIQKSTRERINAHGIRGDSYDIVLNKVFDTIDKKVKQ